VVVVLLLLQGDYYEKLGVQKGATKDELKKAYYKLAKKYHPGTHVYCCHLAWALITLP
jgi:hypothetical protein